MIPDHCRHVSLHKVKFQLTAARIEEELLDGKIYKGTEFLIFNNNSDWSVVRVQKTPRRGLFWLVTGVEIISEPSNTIYVDNPKVDVLNKNMMAQVSVENPDKVVVVKGTFEHISFVTPEPAVELLLVEVIPPEPAKLNKLVKNLLGITSFSKPIIIKETIIDINSFINEELATAIVLPCNATGFKTEKTVYYLDENPVLPQEHNGIVLVGCDLSLRIFKELYDFTPKFINICPSKLAEEYSKTANVMVRCCKVKDFERKGNLYMVPWGATYDDIKLAIKNLLESE